MYISHSLHLFINGCLDYFHILAIISNAEMSIGGYLVELLFLLPLDE